MALLVIGGDSRYTNTIEHDPGGLMVNLTLAIDEEILHRAEDRAAEQGTSVNALLQEYLEAFAGSQRTRRQAIHEILELSRTSGSRRGGRTWTRDDLHER